MTHPIPMYDTVRIEPDDEGLTLFWDAEETSFFHYFWLRSACHCELCGDSLTGSRRLHPSDVPLDIKPASIDASGELKIIWQDDRHVSSYDFAWLREYRYDGSASTSSWQPKLWDASLEIDDISHQLSAVSVDSSAYLSFLRHLRDYGITILRDGQRRDAGIEHMASLIGEIADAAYTPVFDLKPRADAHTYGNTTQTIPPHTDEAYLHNPTGILVLYCINPAADGGDTVMVDGFQIATRLRQQDPQAYKLLTICPQAYHRIVPGAGMDYRTRARALNVDERGNLVGFRFHPRAMAPNDVPGELAKRLHQANFELSELMLKSENQLSFPLAAGDAVFFDNHRIMHSRTGFNDLQRHLQICNLSRERFHQQLRLTARNQGFIDEARQCLPAGVSG